MVRSKTKALLTSVSLLFCTGLQASDYGTTGLIDIPTARMASDGVLTATAAIQSSTNAYSVTYQVLPRLEGTFRYTGFNDFFYYDRNYEAKLLLLREQELMPQLAVGIRDLVGTGVFGSEYLVASKKIGNFDVTLGMGWGRLAGDGLASNPLTSISESFSVRNNDVGRGGELSSGAFFSGSEVGLFGGISYQLDNIPLAMKLEYNPDQYDWEKGNASEFKIKSPWSAAVSWEALPGIKLSLSHQHGQEWGFSIAAALDTKATPARRPLRPIKSSADFAPEDLPPMLNKASWYDMLLYDVERSGLVLVEASIDPKTQMATLVMGNRDYPIWADAIARMTTLADLHLPSEVRSMRFVLEEEGHQVFTAPAYRPSRQTISYHQYQQRDFDLLRADPPQPPQHRTGFDQKKLFIDVGLSSRLQLFDPDDPARYQLYGKLGISAALPKNWSLRGEYAIDIVNTFDESSRRSDSVLPHVRSDIVEYLQQGATGLESLYLDKRGTLVPQLHYRVFGGVLEQMYAGAGGEILYQPHKSRLAFGLSGSWVQQRGYQRNLDLLGYKTTTGFASAYWASPFYNLDFALHAGRYLAKDKGATLEARRTFANGWMVGLWATITDVPFDDFGEGSFDKGMFFKIPLNGVFGGSGRGSYSNRVRPIQRDGGARLEDFSGDIWWNLRGVGYDALQEHKDRAVP